MKILEKLKLLTNVLESKGEHEHFTTFIVLRLAHEYLLLIISIIIMNALVQREKAKWQTQFKVDLVRHESIK